MTTLNELRSQADEIASAGHAGWGNTMRDAADEIDRLTREAVAADIRIANDALVIAGLTAERDALKAERADLLSLALQAKRHHDKVVAELEMSKMKTYAASISPIAKERDELRAALAERDAKLAALEKQEPVAGTIKIGDKILAAPSGSCSTTHFVTINVISNSRAIAPVVNQHTRLHYLKGSDAIATFCALSDLFSGACQETSRVNKPNLYAAAGAAPVPTDTERAALIEKLRKTDWTISASDLADLCAEAATMLATSPKEPT